MLGGAPLVFYPPCVRKDCRRRALTMATAAELGNSKAKIRQIMVKAHTRPLTMVKYNREGDLLFTTGKDHTPSIYYADNGERIGTYDGHNGTVWCIDVNCALPSWS